MALEIVESSIVKPSASLPNPLLNTMVPLTIFDQATFNVHIPLIFIFERPGPSTEDLKQACSQLLNHFPHMAGRMAIDKRGRPCIHLNNAGARFVETRIGTTLADCLPLKPSPELRKILLPPIEGIDELSQCQINRYTCGGVVFGVTVHHRVADGQSMSNFVMSMFRTVQGLEINPLPFHDRAAVSVPRNPPLCEFDHREIEFRVGASSAASTTTSPSPIASFIIHYSPEFMSKLRAHVRTLDPGPKFTTFECLLTHLWKKITLVRGLDGNEFTQVRVAVNGRERMKPPVPMEYFGNLVLWAYPRLKVKDLLKESYAFVTKTIRDAVNKVDSAYFQSFIDFGEMLKVEERRALEATAPKEGAMLCPNIEVDSWLKFNFQEFSLGSGTPSALLVPELPAEGMLVFMPSSKGNGAVEAFISLQHQHVDHFKQISHSLPGEAGSEPSHGTQNSSRSHL